MRIMHKAFCRCVFSPQSQLYMHLTNYSVNKHNENFERDETVDKGSKRSISWFTEFLRTNDYDVAKFWGDVSVSGRPTPNRRKTRTQLHSCAHPQKSEDAEFDNKILST